LATHDNPGFRASLRSALQAILGDGFLCTLLAALTQERPFRETELLLNALDRKLDVTAVVHAIRQERPWASVALGLLKDQSIRLQAGTFTDLLSELDRCDLTIPNQVSAQSDTDSTLRIHLGDSDSLLKAEKVFRQWVLAEKHVSDNPKKFQDALAVICAQPMSVTFEHFVSNHLSPFLNLVRSTQGNQKEHLFQLLETISSRLPTELKISVNSTLRIILKQESIPFERVLDLMRQCGAVLDEEVGSLALRADSIPIKRWGLQSRILMKNFRSDELIQLLQGTKDSSFRREIICIALKRGWFTELIAEIDTAVSVRELRDQWDRLHHVLPDLDSLWSAWKTAPSRQRNDLLNWLAQSEEPRVTQLMLNLFRESDQHNDITSQYLRSHPSADLEEQLVQLLDSSEQQIRRKAAQLLLSYSQCKHRQLILTTYLSGQLGDDALFMRLHRNEIAEVKKCIQEGRNIENCLDLIVGYILKLKKKSQRSCS